MKILFVCTGNICRSPAAEAVMRKLSTEAGLEWHLDSAGIGNWHAGEPPDARAQKAAHSRGYDMNGIKARSLRTEDFTEFDRIYAMSSEHLEVLREHAPTSGGAELLMFLGDGSDVPDPYYGDGDGFEHMMDLLEESCHRILKGS